MYVWTPFLGLGSLQPNYNRGEKGYEALSIGKICFVLLAKDWSIMGYYYF